MNTGPKQSGGAPPRQLRWYQRLLLRCLAALLRLWVRTLRFSWGAEMQALMDGELPPAVVILWHNRLFVAPSFFSRYFRQRTLAGLISASGDGAWLAAFVEMLGIQPIRGSRYNRGPQAVRELIVANRAGFHVAVTPDGSRGPMYDMKPGAVSVARKTGAPVLLLSFNFQRAWRLKSWDRFFIPVPFSRVDVQTELIEDSCELNAGDPEQAAVLLKAKLDAITRD